MMGKLPFMFILWIGIVKCDIWPPFPPVPIPDKSRSSNEIDDISTDAYVFETDRLDWTEGSSRLLPSVGNGHLATTVYSDTIHINGLYNGYANQSSLARIHALHASNISVPLSMEFSHLYTLDTRQELETTKLISGGDSSVRGDGGGRGCEVRADSTYTIPQHKACMYEEFINSSTVMVMYRTYAHSFFNRLLVTEVHITRQPGVVGPLEVSRQSLVGALSTDFNWDNVDDYNVTFRYRTGTTQESESTNGPLQDVHLYFTDIDDTWALVESENENSFIYIMSMDTDMENAKRHFDKGIEYLIAGDFDTMRSLHTSNWADIWNSGSIELETTDLNLEKSVAGSLYYLYSSLPSHHTYTANKQYYGLSPTGLVNGYNGSDYGGHVMWDQEMWMLPALLMFRPDLAQTMLSYRIHTMEGAFSNAAQEGYMGTRYAWKSAYSGTEVSSDPHDVKKQHVTGDIAFAARQYLAATWDTDWLMYNTGLDNTGFEFVQEMARFWYSRPSWNSTKQQYEINGVIPPDEFQDGVHNSITTNLLANYAIHSARWAACLAGEDQDVSVPDRWLNVAQRLVFTYDQEMRFHQQFEGYSENNDGDQTQQVNVALLSYPLLWNMPDDVRRNDLEHYEPLTDPSARSMTWSAYAIGWLDQGEEHRAQELFNRSYQRNIMEPFKVWSEYEDGEGALNYLPGGGAFLQALVYGYGGLRLYPEALEVKDTFLPPNVTKLTLRDIDYLGSAFDLELTSDAVNLTHRVAGNYSLVLEYDGLTQELDTPGKSYSFHRTDFRVYSSVSTGCDPPQDDIQVDYDEGRTTSPKPTDPDVSGQPVMSGSWMLLVIVACSALWDRF